MDQNQLRSLLLLSELPENTGQAAPSPSHLDFEMPEIGEQPSSGLNQLLGFGDRASFPPPSPLNFGNHTGGAMGLAGLPAQLASLIPTLLGLKGRILEELENNPLKLKDLNPTRRESLALYLDRMAGQSPAPSVLHGNTDPMGGLSRWIEGPRNPAQNRALQAYFEEVALLVLGQALLLKSWSDRGIRAWNRTDLDKLNWALSSALRPHVPLDREGWQIARQNIYSWYKPHAQIQQEIWSALEHWRITDEGPSFLSYLLGPGRQARIGLFEEGYDPRFLKALWDHSAQFGFNPAPDTGPLKRAKTVFSPTLRDGSMVRTGPVTVNWIGLENSSFLLMASELVQLWWGPAPPPLWAVGNGLEVHSRDQLALALGSPKPSQLSRITEMEACEAAFLLEERCVRPHGRSLEAQRLREQLDQLPYFKKLRSPGTSLGDLQACVALSKLRPGGLLWWAREEPLTDNDGSEFLHFVLERAKIVCEWDFSELEHSLPTPLALFPKRLYLLAREPRVEERHNHRPSRVTLQGQIRSHVEIPLVFQDALGALHRPIQPHGHWKVHEHRSPSVQRDWAERWPDPSNQGQLRNLERLRQASLPLATFATVRPTPEGDPANDHRWSVHPSVRGLWIRGESNGEGGRKLYAEALPRPGRETKGHGLMLIVPDESWVAPLASYLRQPESSTWLDHHCERRGDRWVLAESTIKFLPIPKLLLSALGVPISGANRENDPSFAQPLPGEWERLATEIPHQPKLVQEALQKIPSDDPISGYLRSALFVRAARALENLSAGQGRLLSVVTAEGRIRWREMLEILPKSECTPLTLHPGLKITGQIPPHIPIGRWDRIRAANAPGILFSTEIGLSLQLSSEASLLIDMLWEQLDGLDHPTWSELVQYLRVPRRLEIAEATASDVLRSHGEQTQRLIELGALVAACAKLY